MEELRCLRCRLEGGGEAEAQRMLEDFTVPQRQFLGIFFGGGWEKNGGNIKKIQEMMGQYVVRYLIIVTRHEDYDEGILSLCDLRL